MADFVEVGLIIPCTPQAVWNIVADFNRFAEWLPVKADIQFPNGTTAAVGVCVKVERESGMGRVHLEQVFDRVDAPKLLGWVNRNETLGGKPITQIKNFTTALTLTPTDDGKTLVKIRSDWTPVGIMGSMANSFMKPRLKHEYEEGLKNIARLATTPPQA